MTSIKITLNAQLTDSQIQHKVKEMLKVLHQNKANATDDVSTIHGGVSAIPLEQLLYSILHLINEKLDEFDEQMVIMIFYESKAGTYIKNIVSINLNDPNQIIPETHVNELVTMQEAINWLQIPFEEIDHWVEHNMLVPFTRNSRVYFTLGQLQDTYLKAYPSK